ncbi:hypothetical protein ACFZC3_28935 [Streptomyces sp. NPDC007903]|uniref:hypothetical protein n=1 Tax=Streptomyces sp. NPDC007903 TaxID=3364786 RepID=UPI0036EE095E
MLAFLFPLAVALLIVVAGTAVLVRRDRWRMEDSSDTLRIEATATRGMRDNRRRAHAHRNRFPREHE